MGDVPGSVRQCAPAVRRRHRRHLQDGTLVLDESFVYADGEHATRLWRIRPLGNGEYEGTAGDVVGTARGRVAGNAMNWVYDLDLPINGSVWRVHFDDWMLLQDPE